MRGEGGVAGVSLSANEYSCSHHVIWSPNKLWRSTSIFNLCPGQFLGGWHKKARKKNSSCLDFQSRWDVAEKEKARIVNRVLPALYCTHGVLSNLQICWGLIKINFSLKEALCESSLVIPIINIKGWLFNVDLTSEARQKGRSIGEAAPERRPEHNSRSHFYPTFCPPTALNSSFHKLIF